MSIFRPLLIVFAAVVAARASVGFCQQRGPTPQQMFL